MKLIYFPIICATMTHPNQGTITTLRNEKGVHEYTSLLVNSMNDTILSKAFSFPLAFLHTSEI